MGEVLDSGTADIIEKKWKRNITVFLTSQSLSMFGSSIVQYAIMWYITLETRSGLMMTVYIICSFIPAFFVSPIAGVWADRYSRKILIIASDSSIAAVTLLLAILYLTGFKEIWLLYVISAIRGIGGAVQMPSVGAIIPQLVPEEKLMRINGINSSLMSAIGFISPIISGAFLSVLSIEIIFFIDVLTATIAVITLLIFLRVPPHSGEEATGKIAYYHDLKEGFLYIRNHSFVRHLFIYSALFFFMIAPAAFLTPLQTARSFGGEVWRLTAIEVTFSAGMVIGGLVIASWGGFKNRTHTMIFAALFLGIATIAYGVASIFWVYCVIMVINGFAIPVYSTPMTVLLQMKVEEKYLGRVFSVLTMISSSMMPMGMLLFGPMADYVRIEWILIGTGIFISCLTISMCFNKTLIEAGVQ